VAKTPAPEAVCEAVAAVAGAAAMR
jgi:hypothetical protein